MGVALFGARAPGEKVPGSIRAMVRVDVDDNDDDNEDYKDNEDKDDKDDKDDNNDNENEDDFEAD